MSETNKQNNKQGHGGLLATGIYLVTLGLIIAFIIQSALGFLQNLAG